MELRGKRILLISPEPWDGFHVSKHHLAQALSARGNTVCFLDAPSSAANGISVRDDQSVRVVNYRHWLRGVNVLPRPLHMAYYRGLLARIAKATGGPFDIIWCFDNSRMQWFPEGMGLRLLHLADFDILHRGPGLVDTADVILATAQVIKEHVEAEHGRAVVNVGHALDPRWLADIDTLIERPLDQPRTAVFAGNLILDYLDWGGFLEMARKHPELEFHFYGPYDPMFPEPALPELLAMPHVRFHGLVSKDQLVPILRQAHLLFYGFRTATRARERANPHKVLEYLSTGNVTVGSWTMEYSSTPDLFHMAGPDEALADRFDKALASFAQANSPRERGRRIGAARERTMDRLIERIEQHLPTP